MSQQKFKSYEKEEEEKTKNLVRTFVSFSFKKEIKEQFSSFHLITRETSIKIHLAIFSYTKIEYN